MRRFRFIAGVAFMSAALAVVPASAFAAAGDPPCPPDGNAVLKIIAPSELAYGLEGKGTLAQSYASGEWSLSAADPVTLSYTSADPAHPIHSPFTRDFGDSVIYDDQHFAIPAPQPGDGAGILTATFSGFSN